MPDPRSFPSGFDSSEDELFIRWCLEYPITKITSVGPVEATGTAAYAELHGRLPDGSWRSEQVPWYWIGWGAVVSVQLRRCGLIGVRDDYVRAIAGADALRAAAGAPLTHMLLACPCCGYLRYVPRRREIDGRQQPAATTKGVDSAA